MVNTTFVAIMRHHHTREKCITMLCLFSAPRGDLQGEKIKQSESRQNLRNVSR